MIRISGIIIGHPCLNPDPKFPAGQTVEKDPERKKDDSRKDAKDAKFEEI